MADKSRTGVATYADYEESDYGRVEEARSAIVKANGTVRGESASEDENEARVIFRVPFDGSEALQKQLEDDGWEVRWL